MENLPPLPPSKDEFWDGEKYSVELKEDGHKCKFKKISSTEIRCDCGRGYTGNNIDMLLNLFDKRK